MAKITKTLTISSPAGGTDGVLSDALSLSMSKDVTINGAAVMKLVTIGTDTQIAGALGRSVVYVKNNSASDTISIYTDSNDGGTGAATELVLEVKGGEFAIFPAALDHALLATASNSPKLEVGIFTE